MDIVILVIVMIQIQNHFRSNRKTKMLQSFKSIGRLYKITDIALILKSFTLKKNDKK